MSYLVIARKWRPQSFDHLIGQQHVAQTLLNAMRSGRLPHALLFTGPRGTGKTSSARIVARYLRCGETLTPESQNEAEEIATGRNVNVIEIDGASNNGVDAIRELRESVGYMPSTGKYKVYIIDEVHMLSTSAFNALLKTLEEPPAHIIFILATTEVNKIPATILSRCQRFDFRRISTRLIAQHLQKICQSDGIKAEEKALWTLARQSDGSMRDSQSLLDQAITFCGGEITQNRLVEVLGLTDRQLLIELLQILVDRAQDRALGLVSQLFTSGLDPQIFMNDLLQEIRNLLMVKIADNQVEKIVDLPESEIKELAELAKKLSAEDIHLLFDMALKSAQDVTRAHDPRLALEMALMRMSVAPRIVDFKQGFLPAAGAETPNAAPVANAQSSVMQVTNAALSTAATTATVTGNLNQRWYELVQNVKRANASIGAKLDQVTAVELKGKHLVLGLPTKYQFLQSQLQDEQFLKRVGNFLKTFWGNGHTIEIRLEAGAQLTPKELDDKKLNQEQVEIQTAIEEHPMVQSTRQVFKAKINAIKEMK